MSYLLVNGDVLRPIEWRLLMPDSMEDERGMWEEVDDDDPRIAQILIPAIAPKWGQFRTAILEDNDFRVVMAGLMQVDQVGGVALMSATNSNEPNEEFIIKAWNALRAGYPGVIPVEAIARWNQVLEAADVPMRWLGDGKLEAI